MNHTYRKLAWTAFALLEELAELETVKRSIPLNWRVQTYLEHYRTTKDGQAASARTEPYIAPWHAR